MTSFKRDFRTNIKRQYRWLTMTESQKIYCGIPTLIFLQIVSSQRCRWRASRTCVASCHWTGLLVDSSKVPLYWRLNFLWRRRHVSSSLPVQVTTGTRASWHRGAVMTRQRSWKLWSSTIWKTSSSGCQHGWAVDQRVDFFDDVVRRFDARVDDARINQDGVTEGILNRIILRLATPISANDLTNFSYVTSMGKNKTNQKRKVVGFFFIPSIRMFFSVRQYTGRFHLVQMYYKFKRTPLMARAVMMRNLTPKLPSGWAFFRQPRCSPI